MIHIRVFFPSSFALKGLDISTLALPLSHLPGNYENKTVAKGPEAEATRWRRQGYPPALTPSSGLLRKSLSVCLVEVPVFAGLLLWWQLTLYPNSVPSLLLPCSLPLTPRVTSSVKFSQRPNQAPLMPETLETSLTSTL